MERTLAIFLLLAACRSPEAHPLEPSGQGGGGSSSSSGTGGEVTGQGGGGGSEPAPALRIGTWNLHNFSEYGTTEYRIGDIAGKIAELDPDVLAVQELKVQTDSGGQGPQAWDTLLETLDGYEGIHNPWNSFDTTVGLLYDPSVATVVDSHPLFEDDSYAFPRPPLEVALALADGSEVTVIVLHLKAFADSVDRRRAACAKLAAHVDADAQVIMLGDLNDDPHDPPADNAFLGTFLDASGYHFLTHALPPESVTSLGYHHFVDGVQIPGELLDHIIVTAAIAEARGTPTPVIHGVPQSDFDAWEADYSDHFPVIVDL